MAPAVGGVAHGSVNTRPRASSRTGEDGPQAEERAIAADAHRIAPVPCDEFLFFVFLAEALKKKHGLSGCKKEVPPNLKVYV